jgi:hypothetical protein
MANALYPKFKQNLLEGDIDFDTGTITAYLVDTADYTYSAAHELVTDLTGGAGVVASQTTAMTSLTDGTLDVADFTFSAVTGDVAEAIVIGVDTFLVAYYDTGVTGLPVTPNSGDINVTVNAAGLFDL